MYDLGSKMKLDTSKAVANGKHVYVGKKYRITLLSESLIRFEYSENGKFNDNLTTIVKNRQFPEPRYIHTADDTWLHFETKFFSMDYVKETPFNSKTLTVRMNHASEFPWSIGQKEVRNFKGTSNSIDNSIELPTLSKGLFSEDGYVTIDDSKSLVLDENSNCYQQSSNIIDLYLFVYGKDFGICLKDYFTLTGAPPLLPRYAFGNWWSKNFEYNENNLLEELDKFEDENIPLSVLLLDNDWSRKNSQFPNATSGFSFNKELFSNPANTINEVHNRNIKFALKINPRFGLMQQEDYFNEALKYIPINKNGYIDFNSFDPKNVDVFLKLFIGPLNNIGVDFFWNDYPCDHLSNLFMLNHYLYLDNTNPNKRGMLLARNTGMSSHRYGVLYSGSTNISWNTLRFLPFYNLNSTNIGNNNWSHDVGGSYGGMEDYDLYLRWIQFSVFSPILRFNVQKGKYFKREPWLWDVVTKDIATYFLTLRHRLIPYIYSEYYKFHKEYHPLIKPFYYNNLSLYDDPVYVNQYYFGSEFMISPVVTPMDPIIGRTIQRFYMPEGVWYDFKNGKRYLGGHKYLSFYKIEDYPIFVKGGAIIPLNNTKDCSNTGIPTNLDIHVFPGQNNTYKLYEDDGISFGYESGKYCITEIDYNYRQSNYTVIIRPIEGSPSNLPSKRNYRVIFRNTKVADNVKVYENGQEIKYETDHNGKDFIVIVNEFSTNSQLVVNCYGKDIEIDALMVIKDDIESIISDVKINTLLKEKIDAVMFDDTLSLAKKRIAIRRLKKFGLDKRNTKLFLKLLEYMSMN